MVRGSKRNVAAFAKHLAASDRTPDACVLHERLTASLLDKNRLTWVAYQPTQDAHNALSAFLATTLHVGRGIRVGVFAPSYLCEQLQRSTCQCLFQWHYRESVHIKVRAGFVNHDIDGHTNHVGFLQIGDKATDKDRGLSYDTVIVASDTSANFMKDVRFLMHVFTIVTPTLPVPFFLPEVERCVLPYS